MGLAPAQLGLLCQPGAGPSWEMPELRCGERFEFTPLPPSKELCVIPLPGLLPEVGKPTDPLIPLREMGFESQFLLGKSSLGHLLP